MVVILEITRKIILCKKLQAEKDQSGSERKRGKRSKTQEYAPINKRNFILKKKKGKRKPRHHILRYKHTQLSESSVSQAEHAEMMNASRSVTLCECFSFL